MSEAIWIALGLVLIVEGLGPLLVPSHWRAMIVEMTRKPDAQLRRVGGCLVVAGAVIVFMLLR
ncbi:DUF2065 domain-containing protein [Vibrio sp. ZSDZ34]|jgi:uncharacterized protein YjeT (DUF2065 family)|uniref:DUF2065 domain-containing protein n=1 Tax=Vibrio gelatinilyticus TaxID=2893468 RepID=A0A9X2AWP9_9VIBR|nr:DUF2065 domain-containing protein [Vibrio gelatinilyticus]MCJ2378159.1 DUF2065 domain-containing protein [Vibrio gelatinilyticus]